MQVNIAVAMTCHNRKSLTIKCIQLFLKNNDISSNDTKYHFLFVTTVQPMAPVLELSKN